MKTTEHGDSSTERSQGLAAKAFEIHRSRKRLELQQMMELIRSARK